MRRSHWGVKMMGRSLLHNRMRTVLSLLGVALGVAIQLAIQLANDMAIGNFSDSLDRVAGTSNLQVVPTQNDDLPQRTAESLRWLWQVGGRAAPVIEQTAIWPGSAEVVQVLGVDMFARLSENGEGFAFQDAPATSLEVRTHHAFVGAGFARAHHLAVGQPFELLISDRAVAITVDGILSQKGLGGAYGGALVVLDIESAQAAFSMPGQVSRFDLHVPESLAERVQQKLSQELGGAFTVQRPGRRTEQVGKMLSAYRYNLTTLSFIALLVGVFLIYNTMSITILRRRPEIGTLRSLGVSRTRIFTLFLGEALLIGTAGTVLGLLLGVGLSHFSAKAVGATVAALYTGREIAGFSINPWLLLQAAGFGLLVTALGALAPVLEATGVAPAEASRRASYETRIERAAGRLALAGLLCAIGAGIAALQPPVYGNLPVFGFVSALLTIVAAALGLPWLLRHALNALLPALKRLTGVEGRLAGLFLRGAQGRTAVSVASLMVGIAMMVSLAVMIGSFRNTVADWVQQTLKADLWIVPASRRDGKQSGRIAPSIIARMQAVSEVAAINRSYEFPIDYKGNPAILAVSDFESFAKHGNLRFVNGEPTALVLRRCLTEPGVIVTESFANRHHVRKGELVTLETPSGAQRFAVQGVYFDYSSDLGYIRMPRPWYQKFYGEDKVSNLAVFLKPGSDGEAVRQKLLVALASSGETGSRMLIRNNAELRAEVLRIFDRTFAITYALHIIAIAVALLTVMNSLFALVLEARRDFGILKYLGASNQQVRRIVLTQAGLLGFFGNLFGLAVGLLLSQLLIHVINLQSFGWTIQFAMPWGFLLQSFLLVMVTALLAGLIPARWAARTPAPEVIRSE